MFSRKSGLCSFPLIRPVLHLCFFVPEFKYQNSFQNSSVFFVPQFKYLNRHPSSGRRWSSQCVLSSQYFSGEQRRQSKLRNVYFHCHFTCTKAKQANFMPSIPCLCKAARASVAHPRPSLHYRRFRLTISLKPRILYLVLTNKPG